MWLDNATISVPGIIARHRGGDEAIAPRWCVHRRRSAIFPGVFRNYPVARGLRYPVQERSDRRVAAYRCWLGFRVRKSRLVRELTVPIGTPRRDKSPGGRVLDRIFSMAGDFSFVGVMFMTMSGVRNHSAEPRSIIARACASH